MRKDINIPKAKNVYVVALLEWDKDFLEQQWNVYLVNGRSDMISGILIMSRGFSEDRKTSTLRHGIEELAPQSSAKIEFITKEVLGFRNEYLVTFFAANKLFERTFVFEPFSISEEALTELPVLETEGIMSQ